MGINVVIQDELGKDLSSQIVIEAKWLPALEDTNFTCLRFVDPYGDTTFNQLQIPFLTEDLRRLRNGLSDTRASDTIQRVESLIQPYNGETHTYVKMIGD